MPKGTAALRKKAWTNLEASVSVSIWRLATWMGDEAPKVVGGVGEAEVDDVGGVEAGLAVADAVDVAVDQ